jgi:hypothetical protein
MLANTVFHRDRQDLLPLEHHYRGTIETKGAVSWTFQSDMNVHGAGISTINSSWSAEVC